VVLLAHSLTESFARSLTHCGQPKVYEFLSAVWCVVSSVRVGMDGCVCHDLVMPYDAVCQWLLRCLVISEMLIE